MKPKDKHKDYIKANRRGSRDAELENSSGWKAVRKIHRSKRTYTRKDKHKESGKSPDFFLPPYFLDVTSVNGPRQKFFRNCPCGKTFQPPHVDTMYFFYTIKILI
jgi:hypothetical protein